LATGASAAVSALGEIDFKARPAKLPKAEDAPVEQKPFWHVKGGKGRAWLDMQNDVTVKDLKLAHQEGFRSVEHLKRYTTLGMATDQGKTANIAALAIKARRYSARPIRPCRSPRLRGAPARRLSVPSG
jgi:hypothetical protein